MLGIAAGVDWSTLGDLERIRPFTDTIHYVLPKLLPVATAFAEGWERKAKVDELLVPEAGIPAGIAEGTASPNFSLIEKIKAALYGIKVVSSNNYAKGEEQPLWEHSVQQNKWNFSNWGGAE